MPNLTEIERTFIVAYLACALWSTSDDTELRGEFLNATFTAESFPVGQLAVAEVQCTEFIRKASNLGSYQWDLTEASQAGHDFWLTRSGHGTGFWDRPEIWGDKKDALADLARGFGEIDLYAGDDEKLYFGGFERILAGVRA